MTAPASGPAPGPGAPAGEARAHAWTLVALLGLATTSLVVSQWRLGVWQMPTALAIAAVKITLVVLVFMGMSRARTSMRLALIIAALLIVSLVLFAGLDVATRISSRQADGVPPPPVTDAPTR